jgi:hypothetical protein
MLLWLIAFRALQNRIGLVSACAEGYALQAQVIVYPLRELAITLKDRHILPTSPRGERLGQQEGNSPADFEA